MSTAPTAAQQVSAAINAEPDPATDKAGNPTAEAASRAMDPEVRIMGQALRLLGELPADAAARIAAYLAKRFPS